MAITERRQAVAEVDPVWTTIRAEAEAMALAEPLVASMVHAVVLHHHSLEDALSFRLAQKLGDAELPAMLLRELAGEAFAADPGIAEAARADIVAVRERDPACGRLIDPVLYLKGFQALTAHRVAHWLWSRRRADLARHLQMRMSEAFSVDIHPAARFGKGIMIDHAHGIVVGETAVVGDDVSMLHDVTLGGTGKEDGDRHPKVGSGVLIGAGAKILGNIRIGDCSRVAAGSVVLADVPPCKTVAGVPARIVGDAGCSNPSRSMDQMIQPAAEDIVPDC
ncbi:serine O-acetyltransferase [Rubrimonas cliftonensis]|uniref:Serine acetyltransferase n=1 Tax=Rubrimonas cliftonensis TaxID=89524 RepID=A0A1H3ZGB5_9RHOB|nr:serine O-acetyltransferase [Rubrimonas cliftonensis]SEA22697.1 serine O-acetyltransferase [Rubrimonas cliftonensis]